MRSQRRRRKRIVARDGSELAPTSKPQPDSTLVKALAQACRWQKQLEDGVYTSVSEIGDAEGISKSYVSRILRLALLAPDIVEAILAGRTDQGMILEQLERPLPATWVEQCRGLGANCSCDGGGSPGHAPAASAAALALRPSAQVESGASCRRPAGSRRRSPYRRQAPRP